MKIHMKTHWYAYGVMALVILGLSACGGAPKAPAEAKAAADTAVRQATGASINPDLLPQPRERLADAPDMVNAKFAINDDTLRKMSQAGVPADVVRQLESLKGQSFDSAVDFRAALNKAIGASATDTHGRTIMSSAMVVELSDAPWVPGTSKSLVTAGAQPMGAMGSPRFTPVFFDFDKYDIKPEFRAAITENAGVLKSNASMKVVIEGHCDERGTTEYNLALGERRARAVRSALIDEGVNPAQLKMVSYGEERPADSGHNEAAWAQNRRAVIVIPQ